MGQTDDTFDVIIIGHGLFGSAAARYLSQWGAAVALIGPPEPPDPARHGGVFASHYDQGRLVRQMGKDAIWSDRARDALRAYDGLAADAGVSFHVPVGCVTAGTPDQASTYARHQQAYAADHAIPHTVYPAGDPRWRALLPHLDFPDRYWVLHEPGPAGYINPRALLRAQTTVARRHGAICVPQMATGVTPSATGVAVTTRDGAVWRARQVLVAAGAFTNFNRLLARPVALRPKTETLLLARVSPATADALSTLPVVIYAIDDPELDDIYMAPPVRYPDGRFYVKLGANTVADTFPTTLSQIQAWFRHGNSDACLPALRRAVQALLPAVPFLSFHTGRCIVCYTPSGYPVIDQVGERVYVAAGGNGSGAKGSDAWGRLAAGLVYDGRWPDGLPRDLFRARQR